MEIGRIEPEEYQVNVREWPVEAAESRLFSGTDSLGNKVAFKVYPTLSMEQVKAYTQVTNQLAEKVNGSKMTVRLEVGGVEDDYVVHIVPVVKLGTVRNPDKPGQEWPCILSDFIDGPSLFDLDRNFVSRHASINRQNPLVDLSQTLGKISERNISIIPWNIKPLEQEGQRTLEVTDICGSIKSL